MTALLCSYELAGQGRSLLSLSRNVFPSVTKNKNKTKRLNVLSVVVAFNGDVLFLCSTRGSQHGLCNSRHLAKARRLPMAYSELKRLLACSFFLFLFLKHLIENQILCRLSLNPILR